MSQFSIVIITRDEEKSLGRTLQAASMVTDDIIIVDSGSTDNTLAIARQFNATIINTTWDGYGANKNKGSDVAKYDWILSIDADEMVDDELRKALSEISFDDPSTIYELKFRTFFSGVVLRYGQTAGEKHIRIFNRTKVRWDNAGVHEKLILPSFTFIKRLPGYILHYSYKDLQDYLTKSNAYTSLRAQEMMNAGKKAGFLKLYLSPPYNFMLNYFIRLGFLDGERGYTYAKLSSTYTFLKYAKLKELLNHGKNLGT